MEKKLAKRKMIHRKYKHYAAALAGAAIMAGASLHGAPLARAATPDNPSISPPAAVQTAATDKNLKKPLASDVDETADATAADPTVAPDQSNRTDNNTVKTPDQKDKSKDEQRHAERDRDKDQGAKREHRDDRYNHDRYRYERWANHERALAQRIAWYNDSHHKIHIYNDNTSPIEIVTSAATDLGFDATNDTFNLVSQNNSQSIVRVVHGGTTYDVTLNHLSNGSWLIFSINQSA